MGPGRKFLTRVWSNFTWSAIFGLGMDLEKFPLKCQIFQFFAIRVKKMSSGWVEKYLGQSRVGLLFTAGQKYVRVGSGWSCDFYPSNQGLTPIRDK